MSKILVLNEYYAVLELMGNQTVAGMFEVVGDAGIEWFRISEFDETGALKSPKDYNPRNAVYSKAIVSKREAFEAMFGEKLARDLFDAGRQCVAKVDACDCGWMAYSKCNEEEIPF